MPAQPKDTPSKPAPAPGAALSVDVPRYVGAEILRQADRLWGAVLDVDVKTEAQRPTDRRWRFFRLNPDPDQPAPTLEPVAGPFVSGHESSFVLSPAGQLTALVASNSDSSGKLLRWPNVADGFKGLSGSPLPSAALPWVPITRAVTLPRERLWSSAGISPQSWVFSPRLKPLPGGKLFAALETADGHSALSEIDAGEGKATDAGFVDPPAINAVPLLYEGKTLVMYRRPDEAWDSYSDDPVLSLSRGPRLLPIAWAARADDGLWKPREEILPGVVGVPVYAFDVASRPSGTLAVAYALGERYSPALVVFPSLGPESLQSPIVKPLEGQVVRLRIEPTARGVVVCVVFRVNAAFRVEFHTLGQ